MSGTCNQNYSDRHGFEASIVNRTDLTALQIFRFHYNFD